MHWMEILLAIFSIPYLMLIMLCGTKSMLHGPGIKKSVFSS